MSIVKLAQKQNEAIQPLDAESEVKSELHGPIWSVISFEKCEASSLTYFEAMAKLDQLERRSIAGLCIVTNDVAARLKIPK